MTSPGLEFLGQYKGSGYVDPPYLLRRADGRMLAVSPLLYMVASRIDDGCDANDIAQDLTRALGRPVEPRNVTYLIEQKLAPPGIVCLGAAVPPSGATDAPVLGIGLRRAILPQGLVDSLSASLAFLFWPPLVIVFVIGMLGFDVWLFAIQGSAGSLSQVMLTPSTMVLAYGLLVLSATFHELGHAAAAQYGGARPGRIGVGLYLIWPAFFSDMTDSYRLTRAGRLRTDLGGVYFNAVFILGCAAVYAMTSAPAILTAIVLQNLLIVSQFVPFLRLDGYYVVSDLIGVPDLFSKVRPVVAAFRRGSGATSGEELRSGARVLVTAWVVVTIPLVAGMAVFALLQLPDIVTGVVRTVPLDSHQFGTALERGDVTLGVISVIQLATLAVVPLGIGLTSVAAARRVFR